MGSQRAKPLLAAWGSREHRCCFVHEEFKFNRVAERATTRVLRAESAEGGGKLSSDVGKWKMDRWFRVPRRRRIDLRPGRLAFHTMASSLLSMRFLQVPRLAPISARSVRQEVRNLG